jgi:hypothetical protein
MIRRLALAACAAAIVLSLAAPAAADQTFWKYSSGPTPKHTATATPNLNSYYLYYPCKSNPGTRNCRRPSPSVRPSAPPRVHPTQAQPRPKASTQPA